MSPRPIKVTLIGGEKEIEDKKYIPIVTSTNFDEELPQTWLQSIQ